MDREKQSGWLLGIMAGTLVLTLAFSMLYINRVVAESERRDCATLLADITAIEHGGQLTDSGARVTLSRRARYAEIGCVPPIPPPHYRIVTPPAQNN